MSSDSHTNSQRVQERWLNFIAAKESLEPLAAAQQWLELFEQANLHWPHFEKVFWVIPGPRAWPALQQILDGKTVSPSLTQFALRLLILRLNGDFPAMEQLFREFRPHAAATDDSFSEILRHFLTVSRDPDFIYETLEWELETARTKDRTTTTPSGDWAGSYTEHHVDLPDVVGLFGEHKASEFLSRALRCIAFRIAEVSGSATKKLLAEVALRKISTQDKLCWQAITSPESAGLLFEALIQRLDGKFRVSPGIGVPTPGFSEGACHGTAFANYILFCLRSGKPLPRLDVVSAHDTEFRASLARACREEAQLPDETLFRAISSIVEAEPEILGFGDEDPLLEEYVRLSIRTGQSSHAIHFLNTAARGVFASHSASFSRARVRASVASGNLDDALRALEAGARDAEEREPTQAHAAFEIADLACHLQRDDLLKNALSRILDRLRLADPHDYITRREIARVAMLLHRENRSRLGEFLLGEALDAFLQPESSNSDLLQALGTIYVDTGRYAQALALLETRPDWLPVDVAGWLYSPTDEDEYAAEKKLGIMSVPVLAATALLRTGRSTGCRPTTKQFAPCSPRCPIRHPEDSIRSSPMSRSHEAL
jgi:tetratricopeptide (TPR) repeat protein